jgi:hypothetical protein
MAYRLRALLIVASLGPPLAAGAPEWEIEPLPGDATWLISNPTGINARGWVSGHAGPHDTALRPILWRDGEYVDLLSEFPGGEAYPRGQASCINEAGWLGGGVASGFLQPTVAALWDGNRGETHVVHPDAADAPGYTFTHSLIMDLNEHGEAAGMVRDFTGGVYQSERAYVWGSYGDPGTLLPFPAGYRSSQAISLDNRGVVGGVAWRTFVGLEACAWVPRPAGEYELIHIHPLLAAADPAIVRSFVTHVDDRGRVYGVGQATGFNSKWTFVWAEDEGVRFLDTDASAGQVWGGSRNALAGFRGNILTGDVVALAWLHETPYVLPQLANHDGHAGASANARGDVVGYALRPGKTTWTQGSDAWVATRVRGG